MALNFIKRFSRTKEGDKTLFEEQLLAYGIEYQRIRPYTPRHNGKVERSHRRDNEVFYSLNKFSSFEDFESKLAALNAFINKLPIRPLNYKSPVEAFDRFL
ncbi:MAG: integrase core domain-containing protein [Selenomonadaceae bacterium]|nr:integrase core domain-containing protein [Selenomonadaceae bacterium]